MPTFIGIDLAWQSDRNHTGAAAFRGDENRVELKTLSSGIATLAGVRDFIADHETDDTVVAIDAPLVIPNPTGQRTCEGLVTSRFGRHHAGAHSSNRTLYPEAGSVRLADGLSERGYRHCTPPGMRLDLAGRWFFEVYPHPAHVILFERDRIVKYKRGRVAERRRGLAEFRREIRARVFGPDSPFVFDRGLERFFRTKIETLRGGDLKAHEDVLDAILCAYLAFHLWRWGWERNEMFGNLESGHIVVPTTPLESAAPRVDGAYADRSAVLAAG